MSPHEELRRLDAAWEQERQKYVITDGEGRQHVPESQGAIVFARAARRRMMLGVLAALCGVLWTFFALSLTRNSHLVMQILLPGLGVLFVAVSLRSSRQFCRVMNELQRQHEHRVANYEAAHANYQARRAKLETDSQCDATSS